MCIPSLQQPKMNFASNKFNEVFEKADSSFNKEYKIDIEALKRASSEAVREADIKTMIQRNRCINQFRDITKMVK